MLAGRGWVEMCTRASPFDLRTLNDVEPRVRGMLQVQGVLLGATILSGPGEESR
jgi:hypothetical protein